MNTFINYLLFALVVPLVCFVFVLVGHTSILYITDVILFTLLNPIDTILLLVAFCLFIYLMSRRYTLA